MPRGKALTIIIRHLVSKRRLRLEAQERRLL